MKKLRLLVLLIILAFSFNVKAEVLLELDCNNKEISSDKSVKCDVILYYEMEGINDIEFNYQTNLTINFINVSGFTSTYNDGKAIIHTDNTLSDQNMNATKIAEFSLSANDKTTNKEIVTFSNILINKTNNIKINDLQEEFIITSDKIVLDNTATLDSITIDKEMIKNFNKDIYEYHNIEVTNEVIFIDAVRTSIKSSATGLGNVRVPKGETIERIVTVTAEDGTIKMYKLFITNISKEINEELKPDAIEINNDNSLKLLEIYQDDEKIDIDFDSNKNNYNIDITDEITKLTIKAVPNDPKASFVKNYGPRDIKISYGYHKELIKIKALNNEERIITININYLDNRNKDNTLKSLKINGNIVDLSKDKLEIVLPFNTIKTNIEAIPNNEKAIVHFEDIELSLGDNNVLVEVTAEDGNTREYDVNVVVEDKIILDDIIITGYNIDFSKDKKIYDLKIDNNVKSLDIIVKPSNIKYQVLNNHDLKNKDKVIINILNSDTKDEYIINIIKEDSVIVNIICYTVFGIGVILFVLSIMYLRKKHKLANVK